MKRVFTAINEFGHTLALVRAKSLDEAKRELGKMFAELADAGFNGYESLSRPVSIVDSRSGFQSEHDFGFPADKQERENEEEFTYRR